LHELLAIAPNCLRHGRTEHHHLLGMGRLHKDVLNVGAHASVSQNLIALVNDEILGVLELHSFVLDEVQQSTRCRYDDVWGVSLVL